MIATQLARDVITTERPVKMPQPRKPYPVNPENPAEVLKVTWAALAGLAGDMVNNPPADLGFDKTSTIIGRMSRAFRNLQPMLTAVGALPPLQPARGARAPFVVPTAATAPPPTTPPGFEHRQVETPETSDARTQKEREKEGADIRLTSAPNAGSAPNNAPPPAPAATTPAPAKEPAERRRFLFNGDIYARMPPHPWPADPDEMAACYDAVIAGADFRAKPRQS